jgi:hypothetical protein
MPRSVAKGESPYHPRNADALHRQRFFIRHIVNLLAMLAGFAGQAPASVCASIGRQRGCPWTNGSPVNSRQSECISNERPQRLAACGHRSYGNEWASRSRGRLRQPGTSRGSRRGATGRTHPPIDRAESGIADRQRRSASGPPTAPGTRALGEGGMDAISKPRPSRCSSRTLSRAPD